MKKKETILLTNEEKIHREQKVCYICTKVFSTDNYNKKIIKSEIIVVTQENIEELLVIFAIQNEKPKRIFCRKSLLSYIRLSFHNQRASRRI